MLFLLQQRLFGFLLSGGEAAHQKALAFILTGHRDSLPGGALKLLQTVVGDFS